ncbi:winged helix-turn-helix domain-containing protein [Actinomadura montaniterrae]|uniref:Helix-turn-helix transcriptional regulator n=1 Tax=Actinomadura montaniterrae TaxID=1803903 RepID=A0A6L3VLF9_9ACTN|nr:winged helix-turn-helix domain-containing protein [Actinomadura montaniterrae]KAB2370447.1 helix-turn-helix transcriptional regulator [Actinomadura montaniterrae]
MKERPPAGPPPEQHPEERPEPEVITDPRQVRLLAHPLRQRIAEIMRRGPVSSTTLARELGQSTGATSYHLRQFAKYGFVEEVPELKRGRERWWRAVPADRRLPPRAEQSPAMRDAVDALTRLEFANELEMLARYQRERDGMGPWADALLFSHSTVTLTPDQVRPFFEEYIALLYRYKRADADPPPGARTLHARFLAFPEV